MGAPPGALSFDYREMVTRNIGFVSEAEQAKLRRSRAFICGVGGMGEACLVALARSGVGALEIADMDHFELSNLNRQVFATLPELGRAKTEVAARRLREINPEIQVVLHDARWRDELDEILRRCPTVVNGMDDIVAGIDLYRRAREHGVTVVDAYTSPLPSVTRVSPHHPRPEERLKFPTVRVPVEQITIEMVAVCRLAEIEYVLVHSSSARAVDLEIAAEMLAGRRPRISFAPMVITTGCLMAYEAIGTMLGRPSGAGFRGYFLDPATGRVERPRPAWIAAVRRSFVRRFLARIRG